MRLHRFYVTEKINPQGELVIHSAELVNQVRRVFRLKVGDSLVIFDGTGSDYECTIDGFGDRHTIKSDNTIRLIVTSASRSRFTPKHTLYLCAALVKKDTFEWIAEKATELGVTHILPVQAEHSEKKALNAKRLEKIVVEASEQSGRGDVPMVRDIMSVFDAVEYLKSLGAAMLAFHTEGERFERDRFVGGEESLAIFIGPEGGWSEEEVDMFHKNKIPLVCLGPQVLRAETAVVAALSQIVFD